MSKIVEYLDERLDMLSEQDKMVLLEEIMERIEDKSIKHRNVNQFLAEAREHYKFRQKNFIDFQKDIYKNEAFNRSNFCQTWELITKTVAKIYGGRTTSDIPREDLRRANTIAMKLTDMIFEEAERQVKRISAVENRENRENRENNTTPFA